MHILSRYILRTGIRFTLFMITVSAFLNLQKAESGLNITLLRCAAIYPLLTLMTLAMFTSAAFLIDIYDRTYNKK